MIYPDERHRLWVTIRQPCGNKPHRPNLSENRPSLEGKLKWATKKSCVASYDFPTRRSSSLKTWGNTKTMENDTSVGSVLQEAQTKADSNLRKYKVDAICYNLMKIEEMKQEIERLKKENVEIEGATTIPQGIRFRE